MSRNGSKDWLLPVAGLILGLLATPAHAVVNVSSCGSLSQAGQTYVLTGDLASSGTCLTLDATGIVVNGNGHTISYASGGTGAGIDVNQGGAEIFGVTFSLGTATPSGSTTYGIDAKADTHIHTNTFNITNNSSLVVYGIRSQGSGLVRIHDNTFSLLGTGSIVGMILNNGNKTGQVYNNVSTMGKDLKYAGGYPMHIYIDQSTPSSGTLDVHHNTLTTLPGGSAYKQQGVQLYRANRVRVYDNNITMDGGNHRAIYLYGYDNKAYNNTITQKGSGSTSQGIRSRFLSGSTEIYGNTIDATQCAGTCHPLLLGGDSSGTNPSGFEVHDNVIRGDTDSLVFLWLGLEDAQFWNNQITVTGGSGWAIKIQKYDQVQNNFSFNNTVIVNNGSNADVVEFVDPGVTNVTFCSVNVDGSPLAGGMISGSGGYTLTSGPCPYGSTATPACSDGQDNDGDGLVDGADPGCSGTSDPSENNCGNGIIDGIEQCDGTQLGGETCASLGQSTGTLACTATCTFDVGGCTVSSNCNPIADKSGWSVAYVDSEELTPGQALPASNAIDGQSGTFWHTEWVATPAPGHPHEIQVDLGAEQQVCGFSYLPRQDTGVESMDGSIRDYQFFLSQDGSTWGQPVFTGQLVPTGSQSKAPVTVQFAPANGRYLRLIALSDSAGTPYTSMAELDVLTGSGSGSSTLGVPTGVQRTDTLP